MGFNHIASKDNYAVVLILCDPKIILTQNEISELSIVLFS